MRQIILFPKVIERFWSRVAVSGPDECWEWQGCRDHGGYGVIWLGVEIGYVARTHRIAIYLATGVDPGQLLVCHRCDNPPCCNPAHLFSCTHRENAIDRSRKGRWQPAGPNTLPVQWKKERRDALEKLRRRFASQS
jgi:hypothetical protein